MAHTCWQSSHSCLEFCLPSRRRSSTFHHGDNVFPRVLALRVASCNHFPQRTTTAIGESKIHACLYQIQFKASFWGGTLEPKWPRNLQASKQLASHCLFGDRWCRNLFFPRQIPWVFFISIHIYMYITVIPVPVQTFPGLWINDPLSAWHLEKGIVEGKE